MSRNLPESPNLEHLKKQAKAVLRELRRRNPDTRLSEAQHAVAREYGFPSWTRLKTHVEGLPNPEEPETQAAGSPGGAGGSGGTSIGTSDASGPEGVFGRYTESARRVIFVARYRANAQGSPLVESGHLLLGIVQEDELLVNRILRSRASAEKIREGLERGTHAADTTGKDGERGLSPECRRILDRAASEAGRRDHRHIRPGHMLLAILDDEDSAAKSLLMELIEAQGMEPAAVREDLVLSLHTAGFLDEVTQLPLGPHPGGGFFARYTEKARATIFIGRYEASERGRSRIETEHLLLGMIRNDPMVVRRFLGPAAALDEIREEIDRRTTRRDKGVSTTADLPLSDESKRALALAGKEADRLQHASVSTGHMLLGLLGETESLAASVLTGILAANGRPLETARRELIASMNEEAA